ncbi:MAG TPA: methyltransferase domain-containing protein [Gemmatimonadaceae bacterium]|nr:methyltransferase domain-containing protein [Gemmatimonadaceae bacterium]
MPATSAAQRVYGEAFGVAEAQHYEQGFVPAIGAPFAAELVAAAALRGGERVLDVACGTGIVARLAADQVGPDGAVSGLDINPAMLSVARSVAQSSGSRIKWYESSAEAMPLPDASFNVAFCQLGLMFMPDQKAAMREMRRVLVAGGRVLVSTARPNALFDAMDAALARHIGPDAAAFVRQVFSLPDPAVHERLLHQAGFRDVQTRIEGKTIHLPPPRTFLRGYINATPLAPAVAQADPRRIAEMEREVETSWKPWAVDDGMAYRQEVAVAIGWV